MLLVLLGVFSAFAQDRTVSGTVLAESDNTPLPGVSVVVKGTTIGTQTDFEGKYTLNVPATAKTLVFSYLENKKEIAIGDQSVIDMTIKDVLQTEEVVVTALGIERQERQLAYSVSTLSSEEVTTVRETNVVNSLQGKIAGIQITQQSGNVGGSTRINIRGINSLSGTSEPLWVVDGVQIFNSNIATGSRISGGFDVGNRAQDINPDDIETITVLKGAAAPALYGSQAANGVILVTTKRAKAGQKTNVTVNSSVRFDRPLVLPSFQNEWGPGNFGKYDVRDGAGGWGPRIAGQRVEDFTGEEVSLQAFPDNVKDFYETGALVINNVSLAGASETNDYRLSITSLNQTGMVPAQGLDRYTISLNAGSKFANNLSSRFGVNYVRTTSVRRAAQGANDPNVLTDIINFWPRTTDVRKLNPWIDPLTGQQINPIDEFTNNPYWIAHENRFDTEVDRLFGFMELDYKPLEFLKFKGRVGYDQLTDDRFRSNRVGTVGREVGDFTDDNLQQRRLTVDVLGTVNKKINEDINFDANFGYQMVQTVFSRLTNNAEQLTIAELFATGNAAANNPVKDFSENRFFGFFADVTLGYRDYLFLNVTGRNDWSSTLPIGNNSYFYPSVNLSFIFTDAFDVGGDILSYGKLRTNYAQVGAGTGAYLLNFRYFPVNSVFGQFGTGNNLPFGGQLGFAGTNQIPPVGLKPEQQRNIEIGAELQFLDGRFGLDVTYYNSTNVDQILGIPVAQSTGFTSALINVGEVTNEGIEIEFNADVIKTNDFRWNTLVTFTHNQNRVTKLADGLERLNVASEFNGLLIVAEEGRPLGFFGGAFRRDTTTNEILVDPRTGLRVQGENRRLGNIDPNFLVGWVNDFSYKGLSLRLTFDYREGGTIFSNTAAQLRRSGLSEETAVNRTSTFIDNQAFIQESDGSLRPNDIPVTHEQFWPAYANASIAEGNIFKGSFIKLREVAINYTLPKSLLQNTFLTGVTVGLEARNLAILYSAVPHIDPETNLFGSGSLGAGVERGGIPSSRSVGANLRISF